MKGSQKRNVVARREIGARVDEHLHGGEVVVEDREVQRRGVELDRTNRCGGTELPALMSNWWVWRSQWSSSSLPVRAAAMRRVCPLRVRRAARSTWASTCCRATGTPPSRICWMSVSGLSVEGWGCAEGAEGFDAWRLGERGAGLSEELLEELSEELSDELSEELSEELSDESSLGDDLGVVLGDVLGFSFDFGFSLDFDFDLDLDLDLDLDFDLGLRSSGDDSVSELSSTGMNSNLISPSSTFSFSFSTFSFSFSTFSFSFSPFFLGANPFNSTFTAFENAPNPYLFPHRSRTTYCCCATGSSTTHSQLGDTQFFSGNARFTNTAGSLCANSSTFFSIGSTFPHFRSNRIASIRCFASSSGSGPRVELFNVSTVLQESKNLFCLI